MGTLTRELFDECADSGENGGGLQLVRFFPVQAVGAIFKPEYQGSQPGSSSHSRLTEAKLFYLRFTVGPGAIRYCRIWFSWIITEHDYCLQVSFQLRMILRVCTILMCWSSILGRLRRNRIILRWCVVYYEDVLILTILLKFWFAGRVYSNE